MQLPKLSRPLKPLAMCPFHIQDGLSVANLCLANEHLFTYSTPKTREYIGAPHPPRLHAQTCVMFASFSWRGGKNTLVPHSLAIRLTFLSTCALSGAEDGILAKMLLFPTLPHASQCALFPAVNQIDSAYVPLCALCKGQE